MNFTELALDERILKAIDEMGFTQPTPIQEKVIPVIFENEQDLIGLAQTGTGKTAAFGLPILGKVDLNSKSVQALILSPTRELGIQIANDIEKFSKYMPSLRLTAVYGGANIASQISSLKKGSHIVVGTPGRTVDLIKRKALKIDNLNCLVLDEADEMLHMGFKEDLDFILSHAPDKKQTLLFSATMPKEIRDIASVYMNNPKEISAGAKNKGAENVSHQYYVTQARDRYNALKRIVDFNPDIYGIVFCRTRSETKLVADKLIQDGYNADALHGDLSQSQRDYVMNRFRIGNIQLLVATDVAARGLDVDNLSHIINYNLPDESEAYIHRSGRTGRAGKTGISIALLHSREMNKLRNIERIVGKKFSHETIPNGPEVCRKQLFKLVDKVENMEVDEEKIAPFMDVIYKKLDWLSREELIRKFVSVEFNRFLEYYKDASDLNINVKSSKRDKSGKLEGIEKTKATGFSRFHINVGSKQGLTTPKMIGLINDYCKRRDLAIGKIDIMKNFSFFDVDDNYDKLILSSFQNAQFENIHLEVQYSKPESKLKKSSAKSASSAGKPRNSYPKGKERDKRRSNNRKDKSYRGR